MLAVIIRTPRPDVPYWSGRRTLAVIDALVWPLLWIFALRHLPAQAGLVGPLGCAVAVLSAVVRSHRAISMNHRYFFTTWRWGKVVAAMLLLGWAMKFTLGA
jgi:hypothetical protein